MDPDDITRLVKELNLSLEGDKDVVAVRTTGHGRDDGESKFQKFVVGKIFATRVVNRETLKQHLPRILQTRGETDIEIVGDNIFVVIFATERDRNHALHDGPWHFFDSLMIFTEPKGLETPSEVRFTKYTTWIQCHNLPLACMNPRTLKKIGEVVGEVEEVDTGEGGNCLGQYGRIRVTRDIEQPLQRCVRITAEPGLESQMVIIRYERLRDFCHACGRVGHSNRLCTDPTADKEKQPYGKWLIATKTAELRRGRGTKSHTADQGNTSPERGEREGANPTSTTREVASRTCDSSQWETTNQLTLFKKKGVEIGTKISSIYSMSGEEAQYMDEGNSVDGNKEGRARAGEAVTEVRTTNKDTKGKAITQYTPSGGWGEPRDEQPTGNDKWQPQLTRSKGSRKGWKRRAREVSKPCMEKGGQLEGPKRRRLTDEMETETPDPKNARTEFATRDNQDLTAVAVVQPRRAP